MARVPNWGPSAGQPVPDEQWDAYMQANPPPANASFAAGPAAQPQGSTGATLGPYAGGAAAAGVDISKGKGVAAMGANRDTYWDQYFKDQFGASLPGHSYGGDNQGQDRLQQQQVIQDLQRQAAGDPNSLAQQQLSQGYGAAEAQQSSLGSTMRGQSAGAAMRGVQAGQQGIQRGYAGDQQMLQAQEQQAAQAMLAQLLAQQHGQDITQATDMATGKLQHQSMIDKYRQAMMGAGLEAGTNAQANALHLGLASQGLDLESSKQTQDFYNKLISGGAAAAASASSFIPTSNGSGYRQVDGKDSIVPDWEK